jgi:micrococcal nuclease
MQLYTYSAICISVHDGDTITCNIDLGMSIWSRGQKIRLARTYAPELDTPEGKQIAQWLTSQLQGQTIIVRTIKQRTAEGFRDKKEKYGRWLGEIYLNDECINDLVISRCASLTSPS